MFLQLSRKKRDNFMRQFLPEQSTGVQSTCFFFQLLLINLAFMKQHLAAIAHTQKELEVYINQLLKQGFETLSEMTKAEDGSYYQALVKSVRDQVSKSEKNSSPQG